MNLTPCPARRTHAKLAVVLLCCVAGPSLGGSNAARARAAQDPPKRAAPVSDAAALRNPVPYTPDAIARGRKHYLRLCQTCHGFDGRALENIDYEAADLTNPEVWRFGTTDGDLFRNTKEGAGQDMPPFGAKLEEREIWELVCYLRSIGPEKLRPNPAADDESSSASELPRK
jgi:cytochrome c oxidase cbb3-type subunit 3